MEPMYRLPWIRYGLMWLQRDREQISRWPPSIRQILESCEDLNM